MVARAVALVAGLIGVKGLAMLPHRLAWQRAAASQALIHPKAGSIALAGLSIVDKTPCHRGDKLNVAGCHQKGISRRCHCRRDEVIGREDLL